MPRNLHIMYLGMKKLVSGIVKIVSEYDQEMPQSQTADNLIAPQGRAAQTSRDTRKTNYAKQPTLFPIKMIAILEWT